MGERVRANCWGQEMVRITSFYAAKHPPREAASNPTLYSLVSLTLIQRLHLPKYPTPTVSCMFFNDLCEK